jgi:hypothetical protein
MLISFQFLSFLHMRLQLANPLFIWLAEGSSQSTDQGWTVGTFASRMLPVCATGTWYT